MKINTLLSMAKKRKNCHIYYDSRQERQWMQLGGNLYPLDGLPYLDRETLLIMMDVPEEKRDDYWIDCGALPERLLPLVADNHSEDLPARKAYLTITPLGEELRPVYIGEREDKTLVLTTESSYRPIADEIDEYLLFAREAMGETYILAKKGFELLAVIGRVVVNSGTELETLQDVERHIRTGMAAIKEEEARRDGEQQHI